jgi:hypothetical protein
MNISRVSHTTTNSKCHQWLTREIFMTDEKRPATGRAGYFCRM